MFATIFFLLLLPILAALVLAVTVFSEWITGKADETDEELGFIRFAYPKNFSSIS